MYAMDGNNSLKRVGPLGGRRVADQRVFEASDYYLKPEEVEKYAHEVKGRRLPPEELPESEEQGNPIAPDHRPKENEEPGEGDPTDAVDLESALKTCVTNWKAAKSEDAKKSWAIYEETGIFASACRHGLLLWIIDMYKSGEL